MKVLQTSTETITKLDTFKMTQGSQIQKVSDNNGKMITPSKWIVYEDVDKKNPDQVNTILSVMDTDGNVYATNSKTFREMFLNIEQIMEGEQYDLLIVSGTSKNGRTFYTCEPMQ